MRYGLLQTVPPTIEPVTLDEAKLFLRVEETIEDALLAAQIKSARQYCEAQTRRSFLTQTWKLTLDGFPGGAPRSAEWAAWSDWLAAGPIRLPRAAPLQAVTSIRYLDSTLTQQTVAPTTYLTLADREPGEVVPVYSQVWPVTITQAAAVEVTYIAGWTAAAGVPEEIVQALKIVLAWHFAEREPHRTELSAVNALLKHWDIAEYG